MFLPPLAVAAEASPVEADPAPGTSPAAPPPAASPVPASAAPASPFLLLPRDGALHPVAWHYGVRYQELLADVMGGPLAPSTLGPTVAEADVYWRFQLGNPRGMPLPEDAAVRWRDTAVSGSILAASRLLDETIARAPQLSAYRAVLDSLVNPNLSVRADERGELTVEHLTGGKRERRLEAAELTDDTPESVPSAGPAARAGSPRRPTSPEPRPDLGVGLDWRLRTEDDPPNTALLSYGVWLSATNLGLTNLRATYSFLNREWTAVARERVYPRVYLYANATSEAASIEPGRYATGVLWAVPFGTGWSVRAERSVTFPSESPDAPEAGYRWMLFVRGEQHTPIPGREGEPLGDGGLCAPALPERGPNELVALNPPSPDRLPPDTCDREGYERR